MIGSFWNLCRACPSMPIDKLHSEYRSTYTWHEFTGSNQEHTVVRRAPQAPPRTSMEPPLPRRKKCPELAYRTHEFISGAAGKAIDGADALDSNVVADRVREATMKTLPASQLSKAISKISTEYRLQFAWPRRQPALSNGELIKDEALLLAQEPRKAARQATPAPVHKKRQLDHKRDGLQASELEPLVKEAADEVDEAKPGHRVGGRAVRIAEPPQQDARKTQERPFSAVEVLQLRRELKRLADEYKHRHWAGGMAVEDEATLWKHVSNNHSLNALALARSATKEEKEKENTRKVGPTAAAVLLPAGRPSSVQAGPIHATPEPDNDRAFLARARKDFLIRHHLDRTTGAGDGALLPSPTREKLEPVIPRRREDTEQQQQQQQQQRSKSSPKSSPRSARSQSVGPSVVDRRSPKRRPPADAKDKDKDKSSERERHPRPMTAEPQVNGLQVAATPTQQRGWVDDEPVVKSPPEPTRVKSPEQMIMRSPEPVNWTVPLDTGKTFTVTQNVREGEPPTRAHSEARSWVGPDGRHQQKLTEHKAQPGYKSPESESVSLGSYTNGHKEDSPGDSPQATIAKDELAQEARCLVEPVFEFAKEEPAEAASDLLEKARNRFDKFWGKSAEQ